MPQSLHDWLVDRLAERNGFKKFAENNAYEIAKNHTDERNRYVGTKDDPIWPDVIVYDPSTTNQLVKRIGEVETDETVTLDHAKGHWDVYADRVPDFILAVPKSLVTEAKEIMQQLEVKCTLWSYEIQTDEKGHATSATFAVES
jgi:hypothetical protein